MVEPATDELILKALEEYASDLDTTFAPSAFVAWVHEHRPELLDEVGEATLGRFASELISKAAKGI